MDPKYEKQMAKLVDAVQPYCDEQITAAMTCSHAGSMGAVLVSKLMDGVGRILPDGNSNDDGGQRTGSHVPRCAGQIILPSVLTF